MAVDVSATRERQRQRRLRRLTIFLLVLATWLWWRLVSGNPVSPGLPQLGPEAIIWVPMMIFFVLIASLFLLPMLSSGRSPHIIYLPEQIEIGFSDVKGLAPVVREVRHTLEVFLNHLRFRDELGGKPRRGVLFEGPPGTGKTHLAKAMAKEAGVPFLFVSSTAFQSMWYGATARKIRNYFKSLRKVARREGGAIGFIEEIDAIGLARSGVSKFSPLAVAGARRVERAGINESAGGVVNELLIQMQSFDEPTRSVRFTNVLIRFANRFLPPGSAIPVRGSEFSNILLIGATNRADNLDPALLRPGRFDRILHFGMPAKRDRRELVDYFLEARNHDEELDDPLARETIAGITMGMTPASLERLFDEALLVALTDDRRSITMPDIRRAQLETQLGLAHPVDYPMEERIAIATHEAGHAAVAHLVGYQRKMEMLSIIKRSDALGMLAHRDQEERYTRSRSELRSLLMIAFGGMAAEEVLLGEAGTGPAGDLAGATKMAVEMVGAYGMADSFISYHAVDEMLAGNLPAKVLADPKGRKAVDRILDEAKAATTRLLSENRFLVEALRDALLDREELVDVEIIDVIEEAVARHGVTDDTNVLVDLREAQDRTPGRRHL